MIKMARKLEAVIFDNDGLLIDSEPCWSQADKLWLSQNGIKYNDELKDKLIGRNQKDCITIFMQNYSLTLPTEEAIRQRLNALRQVYSNIGNILMPGAEELVRELHNSGIRLAIASGSSQDILDIIIDRQGLKPYFNFVFASDGRVSRGKPFLDIYIYSAGALQIPIQNCAVFEDAENGVVAAREGGFYTIAVPNHYTRHQDFSRANLVISSLEQISVQRLRYLLINSE